LERGAYGSVVGQDVVEDAVGLEVLLHHTDERIHVLLHVGELRPEHDVGQLQLGL
jgi:hypothetical protein